MYSNDIHALDLKTWTWTKLSPGGSPPVKCAYLSTWLYRGNIFGFGGETSENPQECTDQGSNSIGKVNSSIIYWNELSLLMCLPYLQIGGRFFQFMIFQLKCLTVLLLQHCFKLLGATIDERQDPHPTLLPHNLCLRRHSHPVWGPKGLSATRHEWPGRQFNGM